MAGRSHGAQLQHLRATVACEEGPHSEILD